MKTIPNHIVTALTGAALLLSSYARADYPLLPVQPGVHGNYKSGMPRLAPQKTQPQPAAPESPEPVPIAEAESGAAVAYFPSGSPEGSGLMIEKSVPAQVLVGQPYQYTYKVSNLTDASLENVILMDRVTGSFSLSDSEPKASNVEGGNATWNLGTFGPKESRTVTVNASSPDEGTVTTCGWATYNPVVCQDIRVLKANIALTRTGPADALICDPIPAILTVKNIGSSVLTDVQVTDNLPVGLTSESRRTLTFDAGSLAPGDSKEFKYDATASATGKFVSAAKATSAEGVSAEATGTTSVHEPVLAITCKATEQQYLGRNFDVSYTISNTGDAPADDTMLEVAVPAGIQVVSAGNGTAANDKINWNLGTVGTDSPQTVTATFSSAAAGAFDFAGTAKGSCAAPVSSSCGTRVIGHAAVLLEKADDPDPVPIGETTTYTVKVTNQGSADDHNVQVVVTVDSQLVPTSSSEGTIAGQTVTLPLVPTLGPKQAVTYTIVAKGVKVGDAHTSFKLSSDVLTSPIMAEESTHVY